MRAFVVAHNAAIDGFDGTDYKVLCDIRAMQPLSQESADLFARAKSYSDAKRNFRGSAVWTRQRRRLPTERARTSKSTGVAPTELMSSDEKVVRAHLARVWREDK